MPSLLCAEVFYFFVSFFFFDFLFFVSSDEMEDCEDGAVDIYKKSATAFL